MPRAPSLNLSNSCNRRKFSWSPMCAPSRAPGPIRNTMQYNQERLPSTLAQFEIAFRHLGAHGGLRHNAPGIAPETNGFWQHDSFHNFADAAMSEAFRAGLARLRQLGNERRCAIMGAETLWWRCHRRIVADYLISAGETVFHILGAGDVARAHLTPAATPGPEGTLVYPGR